LKLRELIRDIPVPIRVAGDLDTDIRRVVEDSRQVRAGDLFVARPGVRSSGERFIQEALARGAVAVLSDSSSSVFPVSANRPVAFLQTSRPATALGWLAQRIYSDPARDLRLFAVTGTNGKTTTAYLVREILRAAGFNCGLIGTVQTDDGRTVLESAMTTPGPVELADLLARMRRNGATAAVLEASSHALAQERLVGINIHVAMFTNLTGDHLDYHATMDNYAAAKARLFDALSPDGFAVVNADDPWSRRMLQNTAAKAVSYALRSPADFSAMIGRCDAAGMDMLVHGPSGLQWNVSSVLVGRHNAQNILCAAVAAWCGGIAPEYILRGVRNLSCVPGRLEPVMAPGVRWSQMPFHALVDYAHTHDALENVLQAVRPWTQGRIICVFGCGGDRDSSKRPKMAAVAERLSDLVIVTSDNPRNESPDAIIQMILAGFSSAMGERLRVCSDRAAAIDLAIALAQPGDMVLIAGKGHEKYQIIGAQRSYFDDVEQAGRALAARFGIRAAG
jgi:UDP-N-acetylmuramoyl-L-alanyl-D-glutamate--2,6-diaminopimelate ligase